ncbi:MAG TPA: MFS transporter [Anaerolineae bacterium]
MTHELTNADKLSGLPWSIASGAANSISAQWTFFGPPFVLLLSELGANNGRIGFLLSLFPFAGLLALVMAPAAARFGNKRTYLVFWGTRYIFAAGLLLIPWLQGRLGATGLELYVSALVLFFAICRAIGEIGYYPWSQEFIPNAVRGKYYASYYGFATLASLGAVLLASYVVGQGTGIGRYMGLIGAGVFFGMITVWLANWVPGGAPQRVEGAARTGPSQRMLDTLSNRNFRAYLVTAALVILGSTPLASFQPLLLKDRIGLEAGLVVLVQAGVLIGGFASGFFWGWLADRYGSKPVIMSVVLVNVLVPAGWLLVPAGSVLTLPAAFVVAFLAGAALNGWQVSSGRLLFGYVIPPAQRTPYTAVHYAWTGVVGGAGPLLAGVLLDSSALHGRWLGVAFDPYAVFLLLSAAISLAGFLVCRTVEGDSDVSFRRFLRLFLRGNPLLALETSLRYGRVQDEAAGVSLTERLGDAHSPLNVEELIEALRDPRHGVRTEAIVSIARAGADPRGPEALLHVLAADTIDLRALAAWALGRSGDRQAIPALREIMAASDGILRMQAARALGYLGDSDAIPALTKGLREAASPDERIACASALGSLRATAAAGDVLALLGATAASPARDELALSLARMIGDEQYYIRLWRATRREPGTALAQAVQVLRKRLRGLPPDAGELPETFSACADQFAAGNLAQAAAQLCAILGAAPAERLDATSAAVIAECQRQLATGADRLEYVLLALHVLENGVTGMAAHLAYTEATAKPDPALPRWKAPD